MRLTLKIYINDIVIVTRDTNIVRACLVIFWAGNPIFLRMHPLRFGEPCRPHARDLAVARSPPQCAIGRSERRRLWGVELGAGRGGVGGGVELGLGVGRGLHRGRRGHLPQGHRGHLLGWRVRLRVCVRVSGLGVGDIVVADTGIGDVERV